MYDSVFNRQDFIFSRQLPQDEPLTSERITAKDFKEIETPAIELFEQTFNRHIEKAVDALRKAISDRDKKTISEYKWGLNIELGQNLWGEWLLGWGKGVNRGNEEVFKGQKIALFKQPEAEEAIIRNVPAEKAIKRRINTLAKDVSDSEWKQIKSAILDTIKPQSATESPISRNEVLKRINVILGDRKNRFKNRAQTIARTELTAAYNAGRLDTYVRSGLVEAVKYQTIFDDRRCEICLSRQGLIVPLDDIENIAKITPPIHPRCRCVLSPVLKTEFEREGKKADRRIDKRNLITLAAPWGIATILAAVLLAGKQPVGVSPKVTDLALAKAVQKISTAIEVPQEVEEKYPVALASSTATRAEVEERLKRYASLVRKRQITPIMLSATVDLQTATFEELRRLFPPQQLTDENLRNIIQYRDKNKGLNSVDELRDILGIGEAKIQALLTAQSQNQLFVFLDPRLNQSAMTLWVKAGGVLTKAEARTVQDLLREQTFDSLEQLEKALLQTRLKQTQIDRLKVLAQQRVGVGGAIVEVATPGETPGARDRRPIPRASQVALRRQAIESVTRERAARLSVLNNDLDSIDNQVSQLREEIINDIRKVARGEVSSPLQDRRNVSSDARNLINESASAVVASEQVAERLKQGLTPFKTDVTRLNNRISQLEDKLTALLDPAIEDYFAARPQVVASVRTEIQAIREQINQVNQYANSTISQARARHKRVLSTGKDISTALPDYSDSISLLQGEMQSVLSRLIVETQLAEGKSAGVSSLRAKYRNLQSALADLNNLASNPLRDRAKDKSLITGNVNTAKKAAANLSNRLSNLEERIANLPARINQLSPSRRQAYRQLRSSLTTTEDYVVPTRQVPGQLGEQARRVKASRLAREAEIDNSYNSIRAKADELRNAADEIVSQKKYKGRPISYWERETLNKTEDIYLKAVAKERELTRGSLKAAVKVQTLEEEVDLLARQIRADIEDPLADNWFDSQGRTLRSSREKVGNARKRINNAVKDIDNSLRDFERLREEVDRLKRELIKVKNRAGSFNLDPRQKANLDRQIDRLTVELSSLNRFEVNSRYYNANVSQYLQEIDLIKQGRSKAVTSRTIERLEQLLAITRGLEGKVSVASNAGVYASYAQAKQRLNQARARLNNLPKRVNNLSDNSRSSWVETRQIKQRTRGSLADLNELVGDYRKDIGKINKRIESLWSSSSTVLADLDSGVYDEVLQDNIQAQQRHIRAAVTDLDESLALMARATDTERGLALVYDDIKQIYDEVDLPGLIRKPGLAIGLDEAVEVKRQVIAAIKRKGDRAAKTIENIIKTNPARSDTRAKLSAIDDQIKQLEDAKDALFSQKAKVDRINDKLTELHQADPIVHRQINPNRLVEEIQENTVTARTRIERQLQELKSAKAKLERDKLRQINYEVRPQTVIEIQSGLPVEVSRPTATLNKDRIIEEVNRYRDRVREFTTTKRAVLEQVGLQLKSRRVKLIGKNSITENLKIGSPLTPGQQRAYNALTSEQKELLVDASRTGVMDLYEDLYQLSLTRGRLELDDIRASRSFLTTLGLTDSRKVARASLKTQKWDEISGHLNNLRNMGYTDLAIEIGEDSVRLLNVPSLPPRASSARFARYQLRQLLTKLGVDENGNPLTVSELRIGEIARGSIALDNPDSFNYQEIMKAISANRQLRYETHKRLDAFNFNRQQYVLEFALHQIS